MNLMNLRVIQKVLNDKRSADAIDCSKCHQEMFGEHIDWHAYSRHLDILYMTGFLKITASGGFTQYGRIK